MKSWRVSACFIIPVIYNWKNGILYPFKFDLLLATSPKLNLKISKMEVQTAHAQGLAQDSEDSPVHLFGGPEAPSLSPSSGSHVPRPLKCTQHFTDLFQEIVIDGEEV